MPSVSIVIVSWNARDDLRACLRSAVDQMKPDDEIIVVDNGSEDGSLEMVEAEFPTVARQQTGSDLGYPAAASRGIAAATREWVLTLNPDAELLPGCLGTLREVASEVAPEVGMLQPRILLRGDPPRTNSTGVQLFPDGGANDRDFGAPVRDDDVRGEIFCPTAGVALYRRAMLEAIRLESGYLDGTYFLYFEDVDMGWRARLAGFSALYIPEANAVHGFQSTADSAPSDMVGIQWRANRLRTLLKNASRRHLLRTLPTTLSHFLWLAVKRKEPIRRFREAIRDGLRGRREVRALIAVDVRALEARWILGQR